MSMKRAPLDGAGLFDSFALSRYRTWRSFHSAHEHEMARMLFSSQLPLPSLIELCRALRHNLGAGLTLRDVFRQQARRGPVAVRPIAERIHQELEEGESLEAALKREKNAFPPLFVALAEVGEQTGSLPEVLTEVEKYLVMQQRLRRQFVAQITWPVVQLFAAIFIIAGMIFLLGIVTPAGGEPFDPLGFGLTGSAGALTWLVGCFGVLAVLVGVYVILTRSLQQKARVDEVLLRLPALGPCLEALALTRFCLALHLTMDTGMPITKALRLSLRGTGNAAYEARTEEVVDGLREGEDLTLVLAQCGLFPQEFLDIVAVAEEGGRVPEALRHQGEYYQEEAGRRLTLLTRVSGYGVWLCVAAMIIFLIIRIMVSYVNLLNSFM